MITLEAVPEQPAVAASGIGRSPTKAVKSSPSGSTLEHRIGSSKVADTTGLAATAVIETKTGVRASTVTVREALTETLPTGSTDWKANAYMPSASAAGVKVHVALAVPQSVHAIPGVEKAAPFTLTRTACTPVPLSAAVPEYVGVVVFVHDAEAGPAVTSTSNTYS